MKVSQVENFDWTYTDEIYDSESAKLVDKEVTLEKIEAIYINPKWKQSKVGDCLTYNKRKIKQEKDEQSSKFDS